MEPCSRSVFMYLITEVLLDDGFPILIRSASASFNSYALDSGVDITTNLDLEVGNSTSSAFLHNWILVHGCVCLELF